MVRKRLWFVVLVAVCFVGVTVGLSLVRSEYEGSSVLALNAGLALAGALVLGGALVALEYLDSA